ncbi:MAG: SDR family NAD(P)-dependent oxidoreductase [Opitutaceae bacterium]|jgi:short-subunit dehydrogenase|nr:SDR family NAD(P)-dependent oxidoreductase [Opitutaceae bacterium]
MRRYSTVIVTGGSSGIGRAFIERLHRVCPDLAFFNLSRRNPDLSLSHLRQLELRHIACDLADPASLAGAAEQVLRGLKEQARPGKILLINNSGFGGYGRVAELGREHQLGMIDVNVRAVVDLTSRLLPAIAERGGTVLTVASLAGFMPTPYTATYGATKAFVLHWTLALDAELRASSRPSRPSRPASRPACGRARALAVCPGPVATEFFRRAGLREGAAGDALAFTVGGVVECSLRALARGRSLCVPGWRPRLVAALVQALPKRWVARAAERVLARYRMSRVNAPAGSGGSGGTEPEAGRS